MYMVLYNASREVHKRRECEFGLCVITICLPVSCFEIWNEGYVF